jgi:hypothetical protein
LEKFDFNLQLFAELTDADIDKLLADDDEEDGDDGLFDEEDDGESDDKPDDADNEDEDDKEFQEKFKGDPKKLMKSFRGANSFIGQQGTLIGELKSELAESRKTNALIIEAIKDLKAGKGDEKPSDDNPFAGLSAEELTDKLMSEPEKVLSQITKAAQAPLMAKLQALEEQIQSDTESKAEMARISAEIQELEAEYGKEYTALKPLMQAMLEDERYSEYASRKGGMETLFFKAKHLAEKRAQGKATTAEKRSARNTSRATQIKGNRKSQDQEFMDWLFD